MTDTPLSTAPSGDEKAMPPLMLHWEPWTPRHATHWRSGFGLVWMIDGRWFYNAIKPCDVAFSTREEAMEACEVVAYDTALASLRPIAEAAFAVRDCDTDIGYVLPDRQKRLVDSCFGVVYGPWAALQIIAARTESLASRLDTATRRAEGLEQKRKQSIEPTVNGEVPLDQWVSRTKALRDELVSKAESLEGIDAWEVARDAAGLSAVLDALDAADQRLEAAVDAGSDAYERGYADGHEDATSLSRQERE